MAGTLENIKRDFFKKQIEFEPVTGFFMGLKEYESKLRVPNEALRNEMRSYFTRLLADLESYRLELLPPEDRIDVRIMRTAAIWNLLKLEENFPLGWRSSTDVSYLVNLVYYNLERQHGKTSEWDAIVSKLDRIPNFIAQTQRDLEQGMKEGAPFYQREIERDGIALASTVAKYFTEEVLSKAKASLSVKDFRKFGPKLISRASKIEAALKKYSTFLKTKVLKKAKVDGFAIGEAQYQWRLTNILYSSETPEHLFAYGKTQVENTEKEMQAVADEIQKSAGKPSAPFHDVIATLAKDAPKTDVEMFENYRAVVRRAVDFLRAKRLFKLPSDYTIDITETPEAYHNVLSVAAMNPIPPFTDGVPAQFWVTPTRSKEFPKGNPKLLAENHAFSIAPNLVVHEAVPGHDLQLGFSARKFIAGGRTDLSYLVHQFMPDVMSSLGVEGWAHYTEQLMAEQGFYSPAEHLFQLKDAQWRNVRIVVDVGIHTGRMSYSEAVRYFNEKTQSGEVTAEREIYRYSKWPLQAITYHLGKKDILALREFAEQQKGKSFDLTKFHELLLSYDGVPISLFREDLISKLNGRSRS